MKLHKLLGAFACGAVTMLFTAQVVSMTDPGVDDQALREAFKQANHRTEFDKKIKLYRGKYEHNFKWWRSPGTAPHESMLRGGTEWVLDSRFMIQRMKGRWLDKSFEAMVILGYDHTNEQYSSVWMDTLGTRMLLSNGTLDESGDTITMRGEYGDAITREKVQVRIVFDVPSRSKKGFKLEMYRTDANGKEFKFLEAITTRYVQRAG